MVNQVVKIVFFREEPERERYAIYRGYDGTIMDWFDVNANISAENTARLPEDIRVNLSCDGAATFDSIEEAEKVIKLLSE